MLMNIRILVIIFSFESITSNVIYLPFSLAEKLVNRTVYFIALAHFHPRQVQKQQRNNMLIHLLFRWLVQFQLGNCVFFHRKKGKVSSRLFHASYDFVCCVCVCVFAAVAVFRSIVLSLLIGAKWMLNVKSAKRFELYRRLYLLVVWSMVMRWWW